MTSPTDDPDRTAVRAADPPTGPGAAPNPSAHEPPNAVSDPHRTAARAAESAAPSVGGDALGTQPDGRSPAPPAPPPPPADLVPGYAIEGELGRGGMGVVYKARHLALNRAVALKLMLGGARTGGFSIRFLAEAEAVAALDHPHVVRVFDYGEAGGKPYMALEFCPGGSLAGRLTAGRGPVPSAAEARDAARLVLQVARGVAAAHGAGIVHRDLKPDNVLFDAAGGAKVADFGLAKRGGGGGLTQLGDAVGTPAYMSPEQARGDSAFVGPPADVWGLGAILYESLTGHEPFAGTVQEIFAAVQHAAPAPPRKVAPAVPRDLELICLKCLEKEPHERYPTAKELADDLDRFLTDQPISVRPPGPAERAAKWVRRNKVVAGAMGAVSLALMVGAGGALAFGLEARGQAWEARRQKREADDAVAREQGEVRRADREATAARRQEGVARDESRRAAEAALELTAQLRETRRVLDLSKVREAQTAFDANLVQLARDTLAEVSPEHRCPAWGLAHRRCEGSLFTLSGHAAVVTAVAVSADGSRVVTASADKTARVWDARTGQPLAELQGHTWWLSSVATSADGSRVVTGSVDHTARVWDARTGRQLLELKPHGAVRRVAMSADGSRLVTVAFGRVTWVWDARTGQPLAELKGHAGDVTAVAVSADGSRVVTGSADRTARLWDARTGRPLLDLNGHAADVTDAALSADGSRVVTGSTDGTARVWDADTGRPTAVFSVCPPVRTVFGPCVAVSADGSRVVTGSPDGAVRVWDPRTGRTVTDLRGHTALVRGVAISADGCRIVSASDDVTARVWDARTAQPPTEFKGHMAGVTSAAVSGDGSRVVTASADKTARVWDARAGRVLAELRGHAAVVTSVAVSADGSRVVTGSADKTARLWDARTGRPQVELKGSTEVVTRVAMSADGSRVVTGSQGGTARVWDARTGQPLAELKGHAGDVTAVAVSADGSRVVTGSTDGAARVWDARTAGLLAERRDFTGKGHLVFVTGVALSADGARAVSASVTGQFRGTVVQTVWAVKMWDTRTGQVLSEFQGHSAVVTSVAVSADGSRVFTGSADETARVWDARTGQPLAELKGHAGDVTAVAVSADGSRVVTGSTDRTARLWDARAKPVTELRGHADAVMSVAVSADGSRVVTGSADETARLWDARTGRPLLELNGLRERVAKVAVSADGTRIVTSGLVGETVVWDAATGARLPGAPLPTLFEPTNRIRDGEFLFLASGSRVLKVPTRIDEDERLRRVWLTRPDPDWHVKRQEELRAEGNTYGAAVQCWAEHNARGALALEAGDHDRAWGHFIVATALKPTPPPPAVVPPAPATIPRAN